MVRLIGPGAAGKSTVGSLLADRLGVPFVDIDAQFMATFGDISRFIKAFSYPVYTETNMGVYLGALNRLAGRNPVLALSSGFMVYPTDTHPKYPVCRRELIESPLTFVLLPSIDREVCVRETVRRQLARPFARSAEREEQVIRARFDLYRTLPCEKVETMRPLTEVVEGIASRLSRRSRVLEE
ncbi:MAG TPA: shikimate kinase [Thermoanaerobaculia bacterium]|nr:shikimate kinase [Thermoanaerobaculia bacterium]